MSKFSDWLQWQKDIPTNADTPDVSGNWTEHEIALTAKIIGLYNLLIPGWCTFNIGFFDESGKYYPQYTRACSVRLSEALVGVWDKVADGSITDEEMDALWSHLEGSAEFKAHCRG